MGSDRCIQEAPEVSRRVTYLKRHKAFRHFRVGNADGATGSDRGHCGTARHHTWHHRSTLERLVHVIGGDIDCRRDRMPIIPKHHPGIDMTQQISQQLGSHPRGDTRPSGINAWCGRLGGLIVSS